METSDIIAYSKPILNEYSGRASSSKLILQAFIWRLKNKGKIKLFKRSFVESVVKRHERRRKIRYPAHFKDRIWIKVIIAVKGDYIISVNTHLLHLPPIRCNNHFAATVGPTQYVDSRCPSDVR